MIKIIFLGDVVGKIGRKALSQYLPKLKKKYKPDLIIANGENIAHGVGFTSSTLEDAISSGVDYFTSGNHAWKKGGSDEILDKRRPVIIRPLNYREKKSGKGYKIIKLGRKKLLLINLLGRVFIDEDLDCPFKKLQNLIKKHKIKNILVDFHAEATSEKNALGKYFNGKVSAVLGTHTHVPTCDEQIFDKGTGYVTDVGMVGYYDGVIGADRESIFNLFLEKGKTSKKHDLPESGECQLNSVYLEINNKTGKCQKIKRLDKIIKIK